MRDATLEQEIESTLYAAGVHNSGELASTIMEHVRDRVRQATSMQPVNQWETAGEIEAKLNKVMEALR